MPPQVTSYQCASLEFTGGPSRWACKAWNRSFRPMRVAKSRLINVSRPHGRSPRPERNLHVRRIPAGVSGLTDCRHIKSQKPHRRLPERDRTSLINRQRPFRKVQVSVRDKPWCSVNPVKSNAKVQLRANSANEAEYELGHQMGHHALDHSPRGKGPLDHPENMRLDSAWAITAFMCRARHTQGRCRRSLRDGPFLFKDVAGHACYG
jgi:hypothetical protein